MTKAFAESYSIARVTIFHIGDSSLRLNRCLLFTQVANTGSSYTSGTLPGSQSCSSDYICKRLTKEEETKKGLSTWFAKGVRWSIVSNWLRQGSLRNITGNAVGSEWGNVPPYQDTVITYVLTIIDLTKAFNTVNRKVLCQVMGKFGSLTTFSKNYPAQNHYIAVLHCPFITMFIRTPIQNIDALYALIR